MILFKCCRRKEHYGLNFAVLSVLDCANNSGFKKGVESKISRRLPGRQKPEKMDKDFARCNCEMY